MITPEAAHLARVLADVVKERARQDAKFGAQIDLFDVSPCRRARDADPDDGARDPRFILDKHAESSYLIRTRRD